MKPKFLVGGAVIATALVYMIYAGVSQSGVYFVTLSIDGVTHDHSKMIVLR